MIQDISIYFEKCPVYCGSNNCPDTGPYYKNGALAQCVNNCNPTYADIPNLKCVSDCPHGFTESATGYTCVLR